MRRAILVTAVCAVAAGVWLIQPLWSYRTSTATTQFLVKPEMFQGGRPVGSDNQQRVWCIGRFEFALPDEFVLAGRSQSIYRVRISTEALTAGKTEQDLWQERLSALKVQSGVPGTTEGRTVASIPGSSAVWYGSNPVFPNDRTLLVMKPVRGHVIFFQVVADAGKEKLAERLVAETAAAYVPDASYGFCVGNGAITSEMSHNEMATATFHYRKDPEVEIYVFTHTTTRPDYAHPLSDVESDRRFFATRGAQLRVLHQNERTVAGLKGQEGRVALTSAEGGTRLRFTWFYHGELARGDRPEILLRASAPDKHQALLNAAWEAMLGSMRPLPPTL